MILVGVSGSIAAYKAADVVRGFRKAGHDVQVFMTPSATRFVGPLTFQALTGRPVPVDLLDPQAYAMTHLEFAERAKAIVFAPVTAETLSNLARGAAGDIVCAVALSVPRDAAGTLSAPIFVAPAMHHAMWHHPATQANVERVKSYGYRLLGPEFGALGRAGDEGDGRMRDPAAIVADVLKAVGR